MLTRPRRTTGQMLTVGADLVRGRYPAPLYGRAAPAGELPPVFCFHGVDSESFEAVLAFLSRNGWRTLTADAYHARLTGAEHAAAGERTVLLTFDDGLRDLWSVALPLLKEYGMCATAFVIPGRVRERVPAGDGAGTGPLATWEELAAMQASGVIDVQCHSWDHRLIWTSPAIVDFVSPQTLAAFQPFEFSMFRADDAPPGTVERPPLGSPIHPTAPRMSAARRYRPDPDLAARCTEHVARHGGPGFFERRDWRRELRALVRAHTRGRPPAGDYETEPERRAAIGRDLERAKAAIEARLAGHRVRHLAWPWGEGSATAVDAARQGGYVACFWARVDGRLVNRVGGDPFRIARIGEDFVRSLPGEGRVPLRRVVAGKLGRRVRRGAPYLSH